MASAQKVKCSKCVKTAVLMCFCQELAFCQGCIGAHLAQDGAMPHHTVTLSSPEMLEIMKAGTVQLNQARAQMISEQQGVLKRKSAIVDRIGKEIHAIDVFEEHTLDLLETITSALVSNLLRTRKAVGLELKQNCQKMRVLLEELREGLSKSSGTESLEVLKTYPGLEVPEHPLLRLNSEYQEIDIENVFRKAFSLEVGWAVSQVSDTFNFLDNDSAGVITVQAGSLREEKRRSVPGFTPAYQSSICLLPKGEFLVSGGGVKSQGSLVGALDSVAVINGSMTSTPLPPMRSQRLGHGSIYSSGFAYILGGWPVSNLCERFSFSDQNWQQISNMKQGRSYPGVCEYETKLYVAGGHEVDSVEIYIPSQDMFISLGIRLPSSGRCALVTGTDQIIAFHGDNISTLKPLKSICVRERGTLWRSDVWIQHPILRDGDVLLIFFQGKLWKYKVNEKELELALEITA